MRFIVGGLLSLSLLVGTAGVGWANCDDDDPSGAKRAAARAQIDAECNCDHTDPPTVNHGQYVKCAKGVAKSRSELPSGDANFLPKTCKGQVTKCAAKSTCGKPGFVTCCITKNAVTKCKTKKGAQKCLDKGGVPGNCASCCDACPAPGVPGCVSPSGAFLDALE